MSSLFVILYKLDVNIFNILASCNKVFFKNFITVLVLKTENMLVNYNENDLDAKTKNKIQVDIDIFSGRFHDVALNAEKIIAIIVKNSIFTTGI